MPQLSRNAKRTKRCGFLSWKLVMELPTFSSKLCTNGNMKCLLAKRLTH